MKKVRRRYAGRGLGCCGVTCVAQQADVLGGSDDKLVLVIRTYFAECSIFRQKSVPGVNGIGARDFGGGDNSIGPQVGIPTFRRTDAHGFIRKSDVQ